jgi:hypothetical protein
MSTQGGGRRPQQTPRWSQDRVQENHKRTENWPQTWSNSMSFLTLRSRNGVLDWWFFK